MVSVSDLTVPPGGDGLHGQVEVVGASAAVWADVPGAWGAAGATVELVVQAGLVAAGLGAVALPAGGGQVRLLVEVDGVGGGDWLHVRVAGAPVPAFVPVPPLRLRIACWGRGE
jgi:hypothetical protein